MYHSAGPLVLWTAPAWTNYIVDALMLPACIFFAAAYLPGRIKLALKHPVLVAVITWAVAHLAVSGDVGGIILFGSVLAWAVYDRITLKHRSDPGGPPIPQGGLRNDIGAVAVGIVLYLVLAFAFHPGWSGGPFSRPLHWEPNVSTGNRTMRATSRATAIVASTIADGLR